ncbi:cytochrome P450 [Xylogone sp. PMI_703]|nr:cytochrome P450 [Xylogone sp. PMI_703]
MICQTFLLAAALSIVAGAVLLLRRIYFHPLSAFPGPKLAAATSFVQFYILWIGREKSWYPELHKKYGPVVRCGPHHLSFNDPDMIPIVYHRQASKTEYPKDFTCPGAASNKESYAEHAAAKRRFGQAYSPSRVQLFEGIVDEQLRKWTDILRDEATKDSLVEWTTWVRYFTFDVFVPMAVGESFGFLDKRGDVRDFLKSTYRIFKRWTLSRYHWITWLAENTALGRWMFVSGRSDKIGMGIWTTEIHEITKRRIAASSTKEKPRYENSMLDQWLSAKSIDGDVIPISDIEDQLVTDVLGGPYALGVPLAALIFVMASHQDVFKQAQREVDEAFVEKRYSGEMPTYAECCQLPYVDACIREALRVSSTGSPRWRSSPDRPLTLMGKYVPPGTAVSTSPHAISTHKKLYGDNAHVYLPDRWLEASEEQLRLWNSYDSHWGFGFRKCPGRHVGVLVLYKALAHLLRRFDIKRENDPPGDDGINPPTQFLRLFPRDIGV